MSLVGAICLVDRGSLLETSLKIIIIFAFPSGGTSCALQHFKITLIGIMITGFYELMVFYDFNIVKVQNY